MKFEKIIKKFGKKMQILKINFEYILIKSHILDLLYLNSSINSRKGVNSLSSTS